MRIIAGTHRSRKLITLEGMNTRPMMDKMKESVFNTIGPYFDDIVVLDLFGGSGALSLEAISRGASKSYIVDASLDAIKIITENVKTLKEESKVNIYRLDYMDALKKFKDLKFDLIFLDPPFKMNIISEIIDFLLDNNMINQNAYIICQYIKGNVEKIDRLNLKKNFSTGSNEVSIYEML